MSGQFNRCLSSKCFKGLQNSQVFAGNGLGRFLTGEHLCHRWTIHLGNLYSACARDVQFNSKLEQPLCRGNQLFCDSYNSSTDPDPDRLHAAERQFPFLSTSLQLFGQN